MKLYRIFIILLVILIASCSRNDKHSIQKLLYFSIGSMCVYDSTGKPQLSLRSYLDYSQDQDIKIAKGNWKYIFDRKAPHYSLDRFYTTNQIDSLKRLIGMTLNDTSYSDLYMEPGDGLIFVLIYKSGNKRKQIIYRPDSLPKQLFELHTYFNTLINSNDLRPFLPFLVDSILINYEKQQFSKYPPPPAPTPPAPIPIDSIKFTTPVVEDTVQ